MAKQIKKLPLDRVVELVIQGLIAVGTLGMLILQALK